MKDKLVSVLTQTLQEMQRDQQLPADIEIPIIITPCKNRRFGDFATNCALILSKAAKKPPQALAEKIIQALPKTDFIQKVEIAGPGFINFFLSEDNILQIIPKVIQEKEKFGYSPVGHNQRVHIEYVSANPTGPLHVGHGRGAAYGASVANLLKAAGFSVHREYYVNDAGRQMQILALSVWLRYLQAHEEEVSLPEKAYQGQYVIDIANTLTERYASRFHHTQESIDARQTDIDIDPEAQLDQLVIIAKNILGEEDFNLVFNTALDEILDDIREDLSEFGVIYDEWFRESQLFTDGLINASVQLLKDHGYVYEKNGAQWFRATQFGDEKDRVLIRSNGITTYFASDVAYHLYKFRQGYDQIIDVFGADHHGYIARIEGFLKALREDPKKVNILLVQFAILYRGKEKVSMSTRGGQFVTLRELRSEVGNDAARYFYIMRKPEQHLDFDLELAKSHSSDNPVYYIQYAHARICSVWRQLEASKQKWDEQIGYDYLSLLTTSYEKDLIKALMHYPDLIKNAALKHEPHSLAHFLLNVANVFHSYYNAEKFLSEQTGLRNARLCLIKAVQQMIANGLGLLGISAPIKM